MAPDVLRLVRYASQNTALARDANQENGSCRSDLPKVRGFGQSVLGGVAQVVIDQ
jgi:hypothetical protein